MVADKISKDVFQITPNKFSTPCIYQTDNGTVLSSLAINGLISFQNTTQYNFNVLNQTGASVTHFVGQTLTYIRIGINNEFNIFASNFSTTWRVVNSVQGGITYNNGIGYDTALNTQVLAPFGDNRSVLDISTPNVETIITKSLFGSSRQGIDSWILTDLNDNPLSGTIATVSITSISNVNGVRFKKVIPSLTIGSTITVWVNYGAAGGGSPITLNVVGGTNLYNGGATNSIFTQRAMSIVVPASREIIIEQPTLTASTTLYLSSIYIFNGAINVTNNLFVNTTIPLGVTTLKNSSYFLFGGQIYKNKVPTSTSQNNAGQGSGAFVLPFYTGDSDIFELANDNGYGASDSPSSSPGTFRYAGVEGSWQCVRPFETNGALNPLFVPRRNFVPVSANMRVYEVNYQVTTIVDFDAPNFAFSLFGDGVVVHTQPFRDVLNNNTNQALFNSRNIIYKDIVGTTNSSVLGYINWRGTGGNAIFFTDCMLLNNNANVIDDTSGRDHNLSFINCLIKGNTTTQPNLVGAINFRLFNSIMINNNYNNVFRRFYTRFTNSFIGEQDLTTTATHTNAPTYLRNNVRNLTPSTNSQIRNQTNVAPLFNNESFNDYSVSPNSPHLFGTLNFNQDFTISGVVRLNNRTKTQLILSTLISTQTPNIGLVAGFNFGANNSVNIGLVTDQQSTLNTCVLLRSDISNIPTGNTFHFTLVKATNNSANWKIFINGVEQPTFLVNSGINIVSGVIPDVNGLAIGDSLSLNSLVRFADILYELKIYNKALSLNEVDILSKTNNTLSIASDNLVANWRLNQKSGTTFTDENGIWNGITLNMTTTTGASNQWVDSRGNSINF